jgi:hypothetical protein
MKLFRGITVSENQALVVIDQINKNGLNYGDGKWRLEMPDLKNIFTSTDWKKYITDQKYREDYFPEKKYMKIVCACADKKSALYYADVHNRTTEHNVPILIEFDALTKDIVIDTRDFLETVFGMWPYSTNTIPKNQQIETILLDIFGKSFNPYIQALYATPTDNHASKMKLVNIASNDSTIIHDHSNNQTWINGRHGTFFRTAFCIRDPILPTQINRVYIPQDSFSTPFEYVHLHDVIH